MKLKEGDIFTVPIDKERIGFGQIVHISNKNNFIIVVFKSVWPINRKMEFAEIVKDDILLMGYTMDAKLYHKHWAVIGNYKDNLSLMQFPYYKLGTFPGDIYLLDHAGKKIRKCTRKEFESLEYRNVVAPVRYEKALKAYYKLEEWQKGFDDLLIENLMKGSLSIEA